MTMKTAVLTATAAMFTTVAIAQDVPKFEVFGDYSYMQYNPTVSGLQSRAFNGGGGQAQVDFGRYFGIKGDFQGYGSTQWTLNVTSPIPTSKGIIPIGTYKSNANMFTYMFGPVVGIHAHHFNVFGEVLLGGSSSTGYASLYNQTIVGGVSSGSGAQHPFTMAVGGGIDLNAGKHLAFRLGEFDWVLTRYTNPFTQTNNQNSFRYLAGVVFKVGAR
jgi:hypothetical protein